MTDRWSGDDPTAMREWTDRGSADGPPPFATDPGSEDRTGRGRRVLGLIAAVAVLAGIGAAAVVLWQNRSSSTVAEEATYLSSSEMAGLAAPTSVPTPVPTPTPTPVPTATPIPTPTPTPEPMIDCVGDVPCCVTGAYLPITEDTLGIAFEYLVDPLEPFAVRYVPAGPVGGFEFEDETWFDFERLDSDDLDRFLVAPRASLSPTGCSFE